ncbi:MAG: CAP domain-containing protein [Planctomycetota bacterium]
MRIPGVVLVAGLAAVSPAAAERVVTAGPEYSNRFVATLEEFPRQLGRGRKLHLEGTLLKGYQNPILVVIAPGGKTSVVEGPARRVIHPRFSYDVRFTEGKGPYRFELIAHGRSGVASAVRFTTYYGVPRLPDDKLPPAPEGAPLPRGLHPRVIEKRLVARLNEFRREAGETPFTWNEEVASRAREHAELMAKARRVLHWFGGRGVRGALQTDGGLGEDWREPAPGWLRVRPRIPFRRPAPAPPQQKPLNYVNVHVLAEKSLDKLFETYYRREPAFRICAVDPHGSQIAVGAAWGGGRVYYAVCFVQVNNRALRRRHEAAWKRALQRAADGTPEDLRRLGVWERPREALRVLDAYRGSRNADLASAVFDTDLLIDEGKARRTLQKLVPVTEKLMAEGRYRDAADLWRPYASVLFDGRIAREVKTRIYQASVAARKELRRILDTGGQNRAARLQDLLRRCEGLKAAPAVARQLEKIRTG